MISRISRNSKRIIAILSQYRSPAQIASAVAVGIVLGLLPKDNLVVLALIVMIACLRINQLVACSTAIVLSVSSAWFSPITSAIGSLLLEQPLMTRAIASLYQYPVLPWTCLENTLVLGGIGSGILTFLPAYALCYWLFSKANQKLESIALEQVVNEAIQYRKSVAEQSKTRQEKPLPPLKILAEDRPNRAPSMPMRTSPSATIPMLPSETQLPRPTVGASDKKARSADRQTKLRRMPTLFTGEVLPASDDTYLRETVIEVVRYRKPVNAGPESQQAKKDHFAVPPMQGNSMPSGNVSTMTSKDSFHQGVTPSSKGLVGQTISYDLSHTASQAGNRDESLKYLLWHINGTKELARRSSEKSA